MKFEWFVSWRYFKRRRGNFFLSGVTLIAILGVAVGVMTVTVVLAVMTGFDKEFEERITTNLPPLIVEADGGIENYRQFILELEKIEHVKRASAFVQGEGLLKHGEDICGVSIMGIDTDRESVLSEVSRNLKYGTFNLDEKVELKRRKKVSIHGIVLGERLALRLGAWTGARVECISAAYSKKSVISCNLTSRVPPGMHRLRSSSKITKGLWRKGQSMSGFVPPKICMQRYQ